MVNLITGDGRVGEMLVTHEDIDKVAFTGSTAVGRRIREAIAGQGKELTLELGGKSPYLVFDDADLDSAVEGQSMLFGSIRDKFVAPDPASSFRKESQMLSTKNSKLEWINSGWAILWTNRSTWGPSSTPINSIPSRLVEDGLRKAALPMSDPVSFLKRAALPPP